MSNTKAVQGESNVFEKVSVKKFNYGEFKEKYLVVGEDDDYDFSSLRNISAVLLEDIFVNDEFKGLGHGKRFVEELKSKNKAIVLYSSFEATEFWKKQGFKHLDGHEYVLVWTK